MKCVVITGAGSGLGRALARRFASNGDAVVLLGRTGAKIEALASELGRESRAIRCDVGCPDSVRAAFLAIAEESSAVDILINNAAIYQPTFVKDATDEQISAAALTNYAGPILCSRAVIPMLRAGSQIINISSETVGLPHAMFALYQSSKAGLERFSEALRAELEIAGVRVTMVRAGQMIDADSNPPPVDASVLRCFAEENMKRGLDLRARPSSSFESAAEVIFAMTNLPADLNVPQIVLEARSVSDNWRT